MNKNKLKSIIQKIENETGLNYNAILIMYFLESILKRIAVSPYKDYFIFKGGFLLSSIIGIENRTTMDRQCIWHRSLPSTICFQVLPVQSTIL